MKNALLALVLVGALPITGATRSESFLSPVYTIDRIYRSMEGPYSEQRITLGRDGNTDLVWIRSMRVDVVGEDGTTPLSSEFMCHVNLDLDPARHAAVFGANSALNPRLLTLTQGQLRLSFPETFGYPIASDEVFTLTTQVVNLKRKNVDLRVRLKVTLDVTDDADRVLAIRPLMNASVFATRRVVESDQRAPSLAAPLTQASVVADTGASCHTPLPIAHTSALVRAPNAMSTSDYRDQDGHLVTGHWIVPPGRQLTETDVTDLLQLPFPTTLHHAAVHVHPYCESLELRDSTTNQTVFKAFAKRRTDGAGLQHIDAFSSVEGVPLFPDHKYKLIAVYDNPTREDQDSMAAMFLGLFNPRFDRTQIALTSSAILIRTAVGDLRVKLLPHVAPRTVAQFVRLVRNHAYDSTHFARLEEGFVAQTSVAPRGDYTERIPLEVDAGATHVRGVLSMARPDDDPDGGESSFSILLGPAPHLDGQYTVFGRLEASESTLAALDRAAAAPPAMKPHIEIMSILIDGEDPQPFRAGRGPTLETPHRAANVRRE